MSTKQRKPIFISSIGPVVLPVNHQGVVFYTTADAESFTITISPDKEPPSTPSEQQFFSLTVDAEQALLQAKTKGEDNPTKIYAEKRDKVAIENNVLVTYWLSFLTNHDLKNGNTIPELRYGKGFAMNKTTLIKRGCKVGNFDALFTYKTRKFVRVTQISSSESSLEHHLFMNKVPVTVDPSPVVVDAATATLLDIDKGKVTLSSMLPTKGRMLFDTVKDLELDPTLIKAINYSLTTKGKTLYSKVQEKQRPASGAIGGDEHFGKDEAYIRVTLGKDTKIGVGIPFVLEIWPAGMKSPIHNHGNATAVIKVLHGEIHVDNYNKLTVPERYPDLSERIDHFTCKKGDLTWIDRNYFQVHQLINKTKEYCATIQCYLYNSDDHVYYPAFDYAEDGKSQVQMFYPDSDFDFDDLRNKVLKEYFDSKNRFFRIGPSRHVGKN